MASIQTNGSLQLELYALRGTEDPPAIESDTWEISVWVRPTRQSGTLDSLFRAILRGQLIVGGEPAGDAMPSFSMQTDEGGIRVGSFQGQEAGRIPLEGPGAVDIDAENPPWVWLSMSCAGAAEPGVDWSGEVEFHWIVDGDPTVYSGTQPVPFTDVRPGRQWVPDLLLGGGASDTLLTELRIWDVVLTDEQRLQQARTRDDLFSPIVSHPLDSAASVADSIFQVTGSGVDSDDEPSFLSAADVGEALDAANVMYSGHSLIFGVPDEVEGLATAGGQTNGWEQQIINGSPIAARTKGDGAHPGTPPWNGYRQGQNRDGEDLDLVAEFRSPAQPYTHLVIAERHDLLGTLQWEGTVRYLRHYYELIREGSPNCVGYLYSAWLDYDAGDLAGWIAYARANDAAHAAVCSRINASLELEERSDRLSLLPASGALAELVERATGDGVEGITGETDGDTLSTIFSDTVHLTDVGKYFMACVVYATVYRRDPRGLAYPEGVTETQAESLQQIAWDVVVDTFDGQHLGPQFTASDAQQEIVDFVSAYAPFAGIDPGDVAELEGLFGGTSTDMSFDADTDASVWYAPPPTGADYEFGATGAEADAETGSPALSLAQHSFGAVGAEAATETGTAVLSQSGPAQFTPAPRERAVRITRTVNDFPAATFRKDPDARMDFGADMTPSLEPGEYVTAATWFAHGPSRGMAISSGGHDAGRAKVWTEGGENAADVFVTCRYSTNFGRTNDSTIRIQLRHT